MQTTPLTSVIADTISAINAQGALPDTPVSKEGDKTLLCPATLMVRIGLEQTQPTAVASFDESLKHHSDKEFIVETAAKAGVPPQLVADILRRNQSLLPKNRVAGMTSFLKRLLDQLGC
jgi:hypothetical protein